MHCFVLGRMASWHLLDMRTVRPYNSLAGGILTRRHQHQQSIFESRKSKKCHFNRRQSVISVTFIFTQEWITFFLLTRYIVKNSLPSSSQPFSCNLIFVLTAFSFTGTLLWNRNQIISKIGHHTKIQDVQGPLTLWCQLLWDWLLNAEHNKDRVPSKCDLQHNGDIFCLWRSVVYKSLQITLEQCSVQWKTASSSQHP